MAPTIARAADAGLVAPATDGTALSEISSGIRMHRIVEGIGHNLPQDARGCLPARSLTLTGGDRCRPALAARRDVVAGARTMERRPHRSLQELLQQDQYTPEEVADLLEIGLDVVRHAAFSGELHAQIAEHDIISIRREDVLAWVRTQEGWDAVRPR